MIYLPNHRKLAGHPFILNSINVKSNRFLNELPNCFVEAAIHGAASGNSTKLSTQQAVKAAVGEHIERLALYKFNRKIKSSDRLLDAFNMLTGEIIKIPAQTVLLEYGLPIFNELDLRDSFSDTCGVASFTSSNAALKSAYFEFIERQSLVHSWLTKKPGRVIPKEVIQDTRYIQLINMSKKYKFIDDVYFFDISITKEIFVVLTIGIGKNNFSIGACADWDLNNAIRGSITEYFQFLHGINKKERIDEKKEYDMYFSYCESLSAEEVHNSYSFLFNNSSNYSVGEIHRKYPDSLVQSIKKVTTELGINIFATYIPDILGLGTKIVKVLSPESYPHMNTAILSPAEHKIFHNLNGKVTDNFSKPIPFP